MSEERYPALTLFDMARIPEEALPRFIRELPYLLDAAREIEEAAGYPQKLIEMELIFTDQKPVWVDDDKETFSIHIEVDGEVVLNRSGKMGEAA